MYFFLFIFTIKLVLYGFSYTHLKICIFVSSNLPIFSLIISLYVYKSMLHYIYLYKYSSISSHCFIVLILGLTLHYIWNLKIQLISNVIFNLYFQCVLIPFSRMSIISRITCFIHPQSPIIAAIHLWSGTQFKQ